MIREASLRLLKAMADEPGPSCVWSLVDGGLAGLDRSTIEEAWLNRVKIVLSPLARVGQIEGKSGSRFLVGRFSAEGAGRPSHPLIVKTRSKSGRGQTLAVEWDRALAAKPHTFDRKDSFAIPIRFDSESDACTRYSGPYLCCHLANRRRRNSMTMSFRLSAIYASCSRALPDQQRLTPIAPSRRHCEP